MARTKKVLQNIDLSDPGYLEGRIKDNTGAGGGTPVSEFVYGDIHQTLAKLMHLYDIKYNGLPDNETNGYQLIDALMALASKNDFILSLTATGDVLNIPIKIGKLKSGESFICKAALNKPATASTVKGTLDNSTKAAVFEGDFKAGEYVRVINNADNISFIRLADFTSFDAIAKFYNFLKKATQAEEDAGDIETAGTTPKSNKAVFSKRVNGTQSINYLASGTQNGLLSKEDKEILNNIGNSRLRNIGSYSGVEVDGTSVGQTFVVSGDITSARVVERTSNGEITRVQFKNAMDSLDYKLNLSVQSQGNIQIDNDIHPVVWKPFSKTEADIYTEETGAGAHNLKIHIDVIQL
ncbi:hypothetical protein [Christiangramia sp.]|uniref:hypothetical protein n=1 Tax=Christiangramia sp. TaxID=1931228 RepID=UPI00263067E4|nr:hypothetical protein [Christiangramia sp.]